MIVVSNVSKSFGAQTLFDNVSVKFTPGNRYGLTGPNGAGKSTFMKILSGEIEPNRRGRWARGGMRGVEANSRHPSAQQLVLQVYFRFTLPAGPRTQSKP